jgi:prepilin-type N-terminal cleavage/methylation domain-containing protein
MKRPHVARPRPQADRGEAGFTLVEVLLVVVILGILAAVAVVALGNLNGNSSQSNCETAFRTVQGAAEAYKAQMGGFPNATAANGGNGALPPTDNDPASTNTAGTTSGAGSELFVKGDTSPNTVASAATSGPWLKVLPVSPGHYSISVSNDGTGTVSVYNKSGVVLGTTASNCPST